jgi:hypothetical protein
MAYGRIRIVNGGAGVTVFAGRIGVTLFGLSLTPVFYVALRALASGRAQHAEAAAMPSAHVTRRP